MVEMVPELARDTDRDDRGRWSVSGGGTGDAESLRDASRNLIGMEGGDSLPRDSPVAGHRDDRESLVEREGLNGRPFTTIPWTGTSRAFPPRGRTAEL